MDTYNYSNSLDDWLNDIGYKLKKYESILEIQ